MFSSFRFLGFVIVIYHCIYYLFILVANWEPNEKHLIDYWFFHWLAFLFYDFQYIYIYICCVCHWPMNQILSIICFNEMMEALMKNLHTVWMLLLLFVYCRFLGLNYYLCLQRYMHFFSIIFGYYLMSPSPQHIKTLEKWPTFRILGGS